MRTAVQICSEASIMIGGQPITSFADATTEAATADALYEASVQDLLTRHPWRFATKQAALARNGTAPEARWDAAYDLPEEMLLILTVTVGGSPIEFDRYGSQILCNAGAADEVVLDYLYRAAEAVWPPYFDAAVRFEMASLLALSLANREGVADAMQGRAIKQLSYARNADSQARTTRAMPNDNLIAARRGRLGLLR